MATLFSVHHFELPKFLFSFLSPPPRGEYVLDDAWRILHFRTSMVFLMLLGTRGPQGQSRPPSGAPCPSYLQWLSEEMREGVVLAPLWPTEEMVLSKSCLISLPFTSHMINYNYTLASFLRCFMIKENN